MKRISLFLIAALFSLSLLPVQINAQETEPPPTGQLIIGGQSIRESLPTAATNPNAPVADRVEAGVVAVGRVQNGKIVEEHLLQPATKPTSTAMGETPNPIAKIVFFVLAHFMTG